MSGPLTFSFFMGSLERKSATNPPPPPEYGAAQLKRDLHKFRVEGGEGVGGAIEGVL